MKATKRKSTSRKKGSKTKSKRGLSGFGAVTNVVKGMGSAALEVGEVTLGIIAGQFAESKLSAVKALNPDTDPTKHYNADGSLNMKGKLKKVAGSAIVTSAGLLGKATLGKNKHVSNVMTGIAAGGGARLIDKAAMAMSKDGKTGFLSGLGLGSNYLDNNGYGGPSNDYLETEEELKRLEAERNFTPELPKKPEKFNGADIEDARVIEEVGGIEEIDLM